MAATGDTEIVLFQVVAVLAFARLGWLLARWTRQPTVVLELLMGILIGPSVLGLVSNPLAPGGVESAKIALQFLAELGAVLLLFEVGLESNVKELTRVGRSSLVVAFLGVAISFTLGYAASWGLAQVGLWSDRMIYHTFIGAVFTATSIGITARVLGESGHLKTPEARIILGAAVIDDVLALLVLAFVASLAAGAVSLATLGLKAGIAVGFIVFTLVLGLKFAPPFFDRLARFGERGVILPFALLIALVLSWLAVKAGLAPIIGAFAAGLILGQTRQHERIEELVRPLAEAFVPVFFVMTGVFVDIAAFGGNTTRILLVGGVLTVVAVLGKLACGWGVRKGEARRLVVGVGMIPRGEVGLIFALFGLTAIGLEAWEYAAILLVIAVSTIIVPVWLRSLLGPGGPPQEPQAPGGAEG